MLSSKVSTQKSLGSFLCQYSNYIPIKNWHLLEHFLNTSTLIDVNFHYAVWLDCKIVVILLSHYITA